MAKSIRSKAKRSFRSKKRESGVYAAAEAGRLHRLNLKLQQTIEKDQDGDVEIDAAGKNTEYPAVYTKPTSKNQTVGADSMQVDVELQPKRISTHGPRNSRREEWRKSKGMAPRPARNGINRQGGLAARRKAGRSHRRR